MSLKPGSSDAARFEAFLCAGIADLCRLVKLPDLNDFCPELRPLKRASTVASIPESPAVAQLALYLLLVTRGLQPKDRKLYPYRDRLRDLLDRIYRTAFKTWIEGNLKNIQRLQPGVRTLAKFARRNIPAFEHTQEGLEAFGVTSLQDSLSILTEKLAMTFARKLAVNAGRTPAERLGASLIASAASPGVIERIGHNHTVKGLMQVGVRAGSAGARLSTAGTNAAVLDDLWKFLKRADQVLGD